MKKYTHLFFDLDHTLWDYERNSEATLSLLYEKYHLDQVNQFTLPELVDVFTTVNENLWDLYHAGQIEQAYIRSERFKMIFEQLGHHFPDTDKISQDYIAECPRMGYTLPGALELLDQLSGSYQLSIITNGFTDIQDTKMSTTGLDTYFDKVFISGNTNFRKPDRELFLIALDETSGDKDSSVMIGDSLESDIRGAKNVPMDQVYFNPKKKSHNEEVTYEITDLLQMLELGF